MFPIRDNIPTRTRPYVTIGLILVNVAIFLFQATRGEEGFREFTWKYGFVPAQLIHSAEDFRDGLRENPPTMPLTDREGRQLVNRFTGRPAFVPDVRSFEAAGAMPAGLNIFTCMFLHGGWMHLLGNMLFLWIFGNNVEDRLGTWLFVIYYLAGGVAGNLLHTYFQPGFVPLVGASGAISAVMGGYLILYPHARVLAIVPIGWYPATFSLPAWIYLGFYIVMQNFFPVFRGSETNVAYWAHIGGFVAGMAMILSFPKHPAAPPPAYDPQRDDADFVL